MGACCATAKPQAAENGMKLERKPPPATPTPVRKKGLIEQMREREALESEYKRQ